MKLRRKYTVWNPNSSVNTQIVHPCCYSGEKWPNISLGWHVRRFAIWMFVAITLVCEMLSAMNMFLTNAPMRLYLPV